jgi:hypothetical protein
VQHKGRKESEGMENVEQECCMFFLYFFYLNVTGFAEILQACCLPTSNIPLYTDLKRNNKIHCVDFSLGCIGFKCLSINFKDFQGFKMTVYQYIPLTYYSPHSAPAFLGRSKTALWDKLKPRSQVKSVPMVKANREGC